MASPYFINRTEPASTSGFISNRKGFRISPRIGGKTRAGSLEKKCYQSIWMSAAATGGHEFYLDTGIERKGCDADSTPDMSACLTKNPYDNLRCAIGNKVLGSEFRNA